MNTNFTNRKLKFLAPRSERFYEIQPRRPLRKSASRRISKHQDHLRDTCTATDQKTQDFLV